MATVAKTSKKPSTHRCTTHQRQYSTEPRWLSGPVHQAGAVEAGDGQRREGEQEQERALLVTAPQRRPQAPEHQPQPEEEAHEEPDLPHPPQVHVLEALVAEEVGEREREILLHGQPLAHQGATDHHHQGAEEDVHPEALVPRLGAAEQRRQVEAGGEPGGGDPEDAQLQMPGARHRVGEVLRQGEAEDPVALDAVVRRERAHDHLEHHHAHDDDEVLVGGALARGRRQPEEGIGLGEVRRPGLGLGAAAGATRPWRRWRRAGGSPRRSSTSRYRRWRRCPPAPRGASSGCR